MTSVPDRPARRKPKRLNYVGGYADVVRVYLELGWPAVLPLPSGRKWPPPTGFTGHDAQIPTHEQVGGWCREHPDGNPALYLVDGLICVDIDNYAKGDRPAGRAREVVDEVEGRAGCRFPGTWLLRNRTDGSEKRFYRVPEGLSWRSKLGAGVDLVHAGHRYVNVGVNPETGNPEQWYTPDAELSPKPPRPQDCAELPDKLVLELMRDANGTEVRGLGTPETARALLDGLPDGVMSVEVRELMTRALRDLSGLNGSRHDATLNHVRGLVEYGAAGLTGTHAALGALKTEFVEAVWQDEGRGTREIADAEFERMVVNGGQLAAAKNAEELALIGAALKAMAPGGRWHPDTLFGSAGEYRVFRVLGPCEWAASVPDTEFLISKALCRDTFGVNGGPKKSLKTHDNQALALAVATGQNLYRSDEFPVRRQGRVLYIVGEGGQEPVQRTLHRMARAYGLNPADIRQDPDFPLTVAFGAAPINSDQFRDEVKRMLDKYQPELVLIESFYNFHPRDVQAGDLYQRGQIIDAYHKFVRAECAGATSLLTDHYRSTGTGRSLDLDSISMAGQAENADSWITRHHRKDPNVPEGEFWLRTGFNSRQWGGTEWQIDWNLGPFNHDVGHHVGEITWEVTSAVSAEKKDGRDRADTSAGRQGLILEYVRANPETSKTAACDVLATRHAMRAKNFRVDWQELESAGLLVQDPDGQVPRKFGDTVRMVKGKVWKCASGKIRQADLREDGDENG